MIDLAELEPNCELCYTNPITGMVEDCRFVALGEPGTVYVSLKREPTPPLQVPLETLAPSTQRPLLTFSPMYSFPHCANLRISKTGYALVTVQDDHELMFSFTTITSLKLKDDVIHIEHVNGVLKMSSTTPILTLQVYQLLVKLWHYYTGFLEETCVE